MPAARRITDVLTREEIKNLVTPTDREGWLSVLTTWGLIAASFALVAWQANVVTIVVALLVLGGRHLALAILMHEASHRSLFASRRLNDIVGEWLCAAPTWQHLHAYRTHHLRHHSFTGTERDPDLGLVTPFPTTKSGLARKFLRDITGIAALKRIVGLLMMDFGYLEYTASTTTRRIDQTGRRLSDVVLTGARNFGPVLLTNLTLFGVLYALGHGWLYLLWVGSWCTTFSLFVRIRAIAEHACTDQTDNPFRNTRTTMAGWLARLTVAPHHVNYHLEHHLLMTVPHYRLRKMNRLLREKGLLDECHTAPGYLAVLKLVTRPA